MTRSVIQQRVRELDRARNKERDKDRPFVVHIIGLLIQNATACDDDDAIHAAWNIWDYVGQPGRSSMPEFKRYRRETIAELRPYVVGEPMVGITISEGDKSAGSPMKGDMIARNPQNHDDQWLVSAKYFAENFKLCD